MTIRLATLKDEPPVKMAFLAMLKDLEGHGHDMLPTPCNAEWMWNYILGPAIHLEQHAIMLAEDKDQVVGAIFWAVNMAQMEYRNGRQAIGYGTWVADDHRNKGISLSLRQHASERLRYLGVKTVIGTVISSNYAGVESALKAGFSVSSHNIELKL